MRNLKHLDISNHKIWEDKNIKPKGRRYSTDSSNKKQRTKKNLRTITK